MKSECNDDRYEQRTNPKHAYLQPITRTVLRVRLTVTPNFRWNDRVHGGTEPFWMWVEDPENNHIYHHEYFLVSKKQVGDDS